MSDPEQPAPDTDTDAVFLPDSENAPTKVAPAMHGDTVWGGPRFIENASHEKVWVETKEEYWALMRKTGFRMKDQQESTTGDPTFASQPIEVPKELREVEVPPMSQSEAQLYGAITAVLKRYRLNETIWCSHCFTRHRHHGVRMRVHAREVSMECRCGKAAYVPPMGTTDTILETIANTSIVALDKQAGTVLTKLGPEFRPSTTLQDAEASIIRSYTLALRKRGKEPRWFHHECYLGRPEREDNALAMSIGENDITLVCPCRILFHRVKRVALVTH